MSHDYEQMRIVEQIKRLQRELGVIDFDKTRSERDEQAQIARLRSEFKTRASKFEARRNQINQEIMAKEAELKRMEMKQRSSGARRLSPVEQAREKRRRR